MADKGENFDVETLFHYSFDGEVYRFYAKYTDGLSGAVAIVDQSYSVKVGFVDAFDDFYKKLSIKLQGFNYSTFGKGLLN